MKRITFTALCFYLLLPLAADAKPKLYKWVDENGVTHYSAQPPVDQKTEEIRVSTGHSEPSKPIATPVSAAAPGAKPNTEAALPAPVASTKDPEKCKATQKNVWNLETFARVRAKDAKTGEIRYLSPEEHKQRLADAKALEKEFCD